MGKTVVIADDHPSFRASARAILEADGYEVVGEAEDGKSAIDAVRRHRPDILLLDVQLPDMDGFEVCESLNGCGPVSLPSVSLPSVSLPSVVLVSSRDGCDYGELIARSGARGFIPKAELSGDSLSATLEG